MEKEEFEELLVELKPYIPIAIYALMVGAILVSIAQEHRTIAIYLILLATAVVSMYVWETDELKF